MFAVVTLQLLAVYVVPLAPYVAVTTFPLVGPKFVPFNVILAPPAVTIDDPPATVVIAGDVYDTVADDNALV